ncbi:MAG: RNA-directed DNA polymerase [Clostridia bacterium]|nr:RNA-directed DNA polymerase [Clostridia bacterium]
MYCSGEKMIVYRELSSVEADLDFSAKTLYSLTNDIEKHYRRVEIPKHDGTFRVLYVPDTLLKTVQRRIANRILLLEPISRYATAYKRGSFIRKNASCHVGKETVLKLDIKHFFDSILYSHVKDKVFTEKRFSEPIRVLLTMLCYYKDRLPQGAPTSPVITNIVMRDFDETVGNWCNQRGITYTRYCDDMTFSGSFDVNEVKIFVKSELRKIGFFLNEKKTVSAKGTQRQIVTGIVVNEKLNVSSEYRKKLRQEVYYCRKYGVEEHLKRIGNSVDAKKYLQGLLGRISYVLEVRCDDKSFLADKEFIAGLIKQYE